MRLLDENELQGVLAHEISHVKNRDILISSIAATIAGVIMWVAHMARFAMFFGAATATGREGGGALAGLVTIIVAPIAAMLIQIWISRTREYQADASGAEIAGSPHGLASALRSSKAIPSGFRWRLPRARRTCSSFIRSPGGGLMNLFSTHPPIQKRIERLLGSQAS